MNCDYELLFLIFVFVSYLSFLYYHICGVEEEKTCECIEEKELEKYLTKEEFIYCLVLISSCFVFSMSFHRDIHFKDHFIEKNTRAIMITKKNIRHLFNCLYTASLYVLPIFTIGCLYLLCSLM